jgi:hypothetical protein
MTISNIIEVPNPNETTFKPIKEKQDIYVPDIINQNISRRNGMVYLLCGSGGSGKSNLLLNMFKSKECYRNKFHNIFYFCPESSMCSLSSHPFKSHDKVYHDLSVSKLEEIYQELVSKKIEVSDKKKKKTKRKTKSKYEDDIIESDSESEEKEIEYSCIILDDQADLLKQKDIQRQLNRMIIKARHIQCSFIITLQSYLYMPKILRKQVTFVSIFKPKNVAEWISISSELLHTNKEDAITIHNYVYDKPYTHLDVDTVESKIYKDFNLLELKN